MVHMINALMGNDMYVAEDRVEEYLAAGHRLAAGSAAEPAEEEKKPVRKNSRKRKEQAHGIICDS